MPSPYFVIVFGAMLLAGSVGFLAAIAEYALQ